MKLSILFLILIFAAAIFVGPHPSDQVSSSIETGTQTKQLDYNLHSESSERLVNIMQSISLPVNDTIGNEISMSEEDLSDLIEAVEELMFYAELMRLKIPRNELDENKTIIFAAMANQLYDEVLNIQQLVEGYDLQIINSEHEHLLYNSFETLSQTCSACHELFRDH